MIAVAIQSSVRGLDRLHDIQKDVIDFGHSESRRRNVVDGLAIHLGSELSRKRGHDFHHQVEWEATTAGVFEHVELAVRLHDSP